MTTPDSYSSTATRFDQKSAADLYATRHGGHARDRREQSCIQRALANVPTGSKVLDLPSGAGRLLPLLHRLGYQITEADYSPHMVSHARSLWQQYLTQTPSASTANVTFETQDIMKITYPDKSFDAVICNRLFHHFTESATRVTALKELSRITKGPIIVSFFNADTIDARFKRLINALRNKTLKGRIPIPMPTFAADARSAGLKLDANFPTRGILSPQTYVRLLPA
jgi:ubiquinone/menaquinone biosynthesis C-methylase UbiE